MNVNRRQFLKINLAAAIASGCGEAPNGQLSAPSLSQASLQQTLQKAWASFSESRPGFRGLLVGHLLTPNASATASAGDTVVSPELHRFRAGSDTKLFTGAAVLLLVQQGRIQLDHTLNDLMPGSNEPYLPNTAQWAIPHRQQITIRLLLSHRAGVFDVSNQNIPSTVSQPYAGQRWFDYIRTNQPDFTVTAADIAEVISSNQLFNHLPDAQYRYSNGGYALLSFIIERASGMRYDQFLQQAIFSKLGMSSSSAPYLGTDQLLPSPFFPGSLYLKPDSNDVTADNISLNVGEGNVITTAPELARFLSSIFNGQLGLSQELVQQMTRVQEATDYNLFYGLGMSFHPGLGFGHDGAHAGYMSTVRYDPQTKTTLVLCVTNLDVFNLVQQLTWLNETAFSVKDLADDVRQGARPVLTGTIPDATN